MSDPTRTSWPKVGLAYFAGVIAALQIGVIAPIVPLLQRDLGLTLPFVGAVLSCVALIAVVLGTVAGNWTNRFGLVRAIVLGLALMAAADALAAVAQNGAALLAIRAVAGLGYLLTVVACPPLIARIVVHHHRGLALALWGSFLPVGIALADAAAAGLLDAIGWRGLFWLDAAVTTATALAALIGLRGLAPGVAHGATTPGLLAIYRMRAPLMLMISFGIFTFTFIVFAAVEPAYLAEARGLALDQAGRISALTTLAAIPGALIAGWLIGRGWSPLRLAWIGLIAPAVLSLGAFLPIFAVGPVVIASALALLLGAFSPAATYALIPRIDPNPLHFAPINGLLMQMGSLGTLIGPPVVGAWAEHLGWASAPILLLALGAAGIACLIDMRRHALVSPR
jgi:MFS family permease